MSDKPSEAKIINLIGGANTGKSTTAMGLVYFMKLAGIRCEYVSEYAKDMVQESRLNILTDQLYILAKQNRRIHRLRHDTQYVITDSPLLLGLVYAHKSDSFALKAALVSYFDSYDNIVFHLPRQEEYKFETEGRVQASHAECAPFDAKIEDVLPHNAIRLSKGTNHVFEILGHLGLKHVIPSWCLPTTGSARFYSGRPNLNQPDMDDYYNRPA